MAEESFQEKTEEATPRKRREAREEGNVAKSTDVNSAVVLLVGMVALRIFGRGMFAKITFAMKWVYSNMDTLSFTSDNLNEMVQTGLLYMVSIMTPLVGVIMVAGVASNVMQSGFLFSGKSMAPKFSKVNPAKGFKRMFGTKGLMEMGKSVAKMFIVGWIGFATVQSEMHTYPHLIDQDVSTIVSFVALLSYKLVLRCSLFLIVVAGIDYAFQKFQYEKQLKMTKQEVKEEMKRSEGDPMIKSRIRSIQMKQARQRMLSDVPQADVVVTNPVHLAVALKYDAEKMGAPIVVAKGASLVAEKIKEIARKHRVPVVENKPVARMLFKTTEVGQAIPYEMYKVVAEILAYVYRLKRNQVA